MPIPSSEGLAVLEAGEWKSSGLPFHVQLLPESSRLMDAAGWEGKNQHQGPWRGGFLPWSGLSPARKGLFHKRGHSRCDSSPGVTPQFQVQLLSASAETEMGLEMK